MTKIKRKQIVDMIVDFYYKTTIEEETLKHEMWYLLENIYHGISGKSLDDLPHKYHLEFWCDDCNEKWEIDSECACDDECPSCKTPYEPWKVTENTVTSTPPSTM